MNWFTLVEHILGIGVGLGAILGPIFVAFYRKDRDALQRLLLAIPDIWNLVQKERQKGSPATAKVDAQTNPLGRAIEVAESIRGRGLNATERARVEAALKSVTVAIKAAQTPVPVPGGTVTGGSIQLSNGPRGFADLAQPAFSGVVATPSTTVPLVMSATVSAPTK